ncbi:hypothetical protein [Bacillus sp. MRMR6]|uniref:hypothetical protein n=1 Tax=Bacillus sp. MRMR6 TaxID=1928617 RepID=UPI000952989B|nr:hypothetical protein [Bacillus sp. MRMR6]OLS40449.1 hypothetical protein BTR25_09865 [Bacillus sp. MRMR6]
MRFIAIILLSLLLTSCGTAVEEVARGESVNEDQEMIEIEQQPAPPQVEQPEQISGTEPVEQPQIVEEEEKYFDEEFLTLAKKGYLKGVDVKVGGLIGEVRQKYGENYIVLDGEGSYFLAYEGAKFHYQARVPYEERENSVDNNEPTTAIDLVMMDELYYRDMVAGLGEASYTFMSELDDSFYMVYNFGDYELWARTSGNEEAPIVFIRLKAIF